MVVDNYKDNLKFNKAIVNKHLKLVSYEDLVCKFSLNLKKHKVIVIEYGEEIYVAPQTTLIDELPRMSVNYLKVKGEVENIGYTDAQYMRIYTVAEMTAFEAAINNLDSAMRELHAIGPVQFEDMDCAGGVFNYSAARLTDKGLVNIELTMWDDKKGFGYTEKTEDEDVAPEAQASYSDIELRVLSKIPPALLDRYSGTDAEKIVQYVNEYFDGDTTM